MLLFFSSCFSDKKNKTELPDSPELKIAKKRWTREDFIRFLKIDMEDTAYLNRILAQDIFRENDTCTGYYVIRKPMNFLNTEKEIKEVFSGNTQITQMTALRDYLYATVPELYIDPIEKYRFNYKLAPDNCMENLERLKQGKEVALCGQYSSLVKLLWESNSSLPTEKLISVSMNQDSGYLLNHTVCVFYFRENNQLCGVVLDAMFGYLYPMHNGKPVTLEKAEKAFHQNNLSEFEAEYAAPQILNNKRFLTDSIWPCNFVEDVAEYYQCLPEALKKYELHQPENISLLNIEKFNQKQYEEDLMKLVLLNSN